MLKSISKKVLIIESSRVILNGLKSTINEIEGLEVVATSTNGVEGFEKFREFMPDLLLISLRLPDICAAEDLLRFVELKPEVPILVCASDPGDIEALNALKHGANGFVTDDLDEKDILTAIETVLKGKTYVPPKLVDKMKESAVYEELTLAESKVLEMIVGGLSNKEIAFAQDVSENTVKTHVRHIFEKLQVSDRTSATVSAIKRGLVRIDI